MQAAWTRYLRPKVFDVFRMIYRTPRTPLRFFPTKLPPIRVPRKNPNPQRCIHSWVRERIFYFRQHKYHTWIADTSYQAQEQPKLRFPDAEDFPLLPACGCIQPDTASRGAQAPLLPVSKDTMRYSKAVPVCLRCFRYKLFCRSDVVLRIRRQRPFSKCRRRTTQERSPPPRKHWLYPCWVYIR